MPRRNERSGLVAAAFSLLLAGCGEADPPPPPKPRSQAPPAPDAAASTPAAAPSRAPVADHQASAAAGDAAELLRSYYRLIDERRYAEANALREPDRSDEKAFAAHFERFASRKVTIGAASAPVDAGDWLYVEVPVQTYGVMKDGKPFGSAGTVTLRRAKSGGSWRIYTK